MPRISGQRLIKVLSKFGWKVARQKGSHVTLVKEGSFVILTVPLHKELDRGTLRSIIRKAGISLEEFKKALED